MILFREKPYPLQMKNIMLLDEQQYDGCLYVSKSTYDQALLLWGRLDGDPSRVEQILAQPTMKYTHDDNFIEFLTELKLSLPKPLNMLAPFIIYAYEGGISFGATDFKKAYGILHMYSQGLIDFNMVTLVKPELRGTLELPIAILNNYENSWDDLCSTLEEKVVLQPVVQQAAPVSAPIQPATSTAQPAVKTEESKPAGKVIRNMNGEVVDMDALNKKLAALKKDQAARAEAKQSGSVVTTTVEPVKKEEPKKEDKPAAALSAAAVLDAYDV